MYSKSEFAAYHEVSISRDELQRAVFWRARVYSYEPVGWYWQGSLLDQWPDGVPAPDYPEFPHNGTREQINAWRATCSQISENAPKPKHLLEEVDGFAEAPNLDDAEHEARRQAHEWVSETMTNYRRK